MLVEDMGAARRLANRLGRHWRWGRRQGFDRLLEEDGLHPVQTVRSRWRRHRWTRRNGAVAGTAAPIYVVGVQRSGTNMLVRAFEARADVRVYNENNRQAFERYRLRSDEHTRSLIDTSRQPYVVFKPLCDSHRTDELLALTPPERGARAIWVHRNVDDRVRSAVAKFGDVNRRVLAEIAGGRTAGRWQAERLSPASLALLHELDVAALSPESAAALFWYVRNELLFSQGFDRRPDVLPVSYDVLVRRPEQVMQQVCGFLDMAWSPQLTAHVDHRSVRAEPRPLALDPVVRARCDELTSRLHAVTVARGMPTKVGP